MAGDHSGEAGGPENVSSPQDDGVGLGDVWDVDVVEGSSAAAILSSGGRSRAAVSDIWVDDADRADRPELTTGTSEAASAVDVEPRKGAASDVLLLVADGRDDVARRTGTDRWRTAVRRRRRILVGVGGGLAAVLLLVVLISGSGAQEEAAGPSPRGEGTATAVGELTGSAAASGEETARPAAPGGLGTSSDGSAEAPGREGGFDPRALDDQASPGGDPDGGNEPGAVSMPPSAPRVAATPSAAPTVSSSLPAAAPTVTATRVVSVPPSGLPPPTTSPPPTVTCREGVPVLSPALGGLGLVDLCG